jgi:peptidoglycan/LPS O-acetylase OafA/YrhL
MGFDPRNGLLFSLISIQYPFTTMAFSLSSSTPVPRGGDYRADVDGLRAIAVLAVVLFHVGFNLSGGFVGVDVFFVISGFLISRLILKELREEKFTFKGFWERRIRRIFPALFFVVIAVAVAGWFLLLPEDFAGVGKGIAAQASMLANVYCCLNMGYFEAADATRPLLHTGSLAVEEQFYMLFPLLLVWLYRKKPGAMVKVLCAVAFVSLAVSSVGAYTWKTPTFFLLPTRAWELLVGALLAVGGSEIKGSARSREVGGWLGIGMVVAAIFCFRSGTPFPGIAALLPCVGTALVIWSSGDCEERSSIGKVLALRPLVFIGLISYPLYLWHWPVIVFTRYWQLGSGTWFRILLVVASMVLATLSWKWLEAPFRRRLAFPTQIRIFSFFAVATAAMLIGGFVITHSGGFRSRFSPEVLAYVKYAVSAKKVKNEKRAYLDLSLKDVASGKLGNIGLEATSEGPWVAVWGDSHAMVMSPAVDEMCKKYGKRGVQATHVGTAPIFNYASSGVGALGSDSVKFNEAVFAYLVQKHITNVVLISRWSQHIGSTEFQTAFVASVKRLRDAGMHVYLVKDVPAAEFDVPRAAALTVWRGGDLNSLGVPQKDYESMNRATDDLFKRVAGAGITVLDPSPYFLNTNGLCRIHRNRELLYVDSHHLSFEGAKLVSPIFQPLFEGQQEMRVSSLK